MGILGTSSWNALTYFYLRVFALTLRGTMFRHGFPAFPSELQLTFSFVVSLEWCFVCSVPHLSFACL